MIKAAENFMNMFTPSECRVVVLVDTHCAIDTGHMIYRVDDKGALATSIPRVRLYFYNGPCMFVLKVLSLAQLLERFVGVSMMRTMAQAESRTLVLQTCGMTFTNPGHFKDIQSLVERFVYC